MLDEKKQLMSANLMGTILKETDLSLLKTIDGFCILLTVRMDDDAFWIY